jgi:hypothetical protein
MRLLQADSATDSLVLCGVARARKQLNTLRMAYIKSLHKEMTSNGAN